jgi:tetratricopeptide (TPR) repeat protein
MRTEAPNAELLAARGSALFRVQRIDDAAAAYRAALVLDPGIAEAHLRLGSGLLPPQSAQIGPELIAAVAAARSGDYDTAAAKLRAVLAEHGGLSLAHRLLGEVLLQQKALRSMALNDAGFRMLQQRLPPVELGALPVGDFLSGYDGLSPGRRAVADRALALFARRLPTLISSGARHDLLAELERTTDAPGREGLRGKRTFDGRVWDDVRGIGGLHAGTGIEALDEAANFGFDTLVHELAHQVHYYALGAGDRARISSLYQQARSQQRFLDYYAASNEAEYFGQGVEAFAALTKRPGCETTHGHTRFELHRVDPALHDFIAGIVDRDPLADPAARGPLLAAAIETALRSGRPHDALVAASWLQDGAYKERVLQECRAAVAEARGL